MSVCFYTQSHNTLVSPHNRKDEISKINPLGFIILNAPFNTSFFSVFSVFNIRILLGANNLI